MFCSQFGKPGTDFDFSKYDFGSLRQKAEKLEGEQKGMKKKVNPKVMATLESVEKRETALRKMYTTVMKDKEKIEETIQELDRYKLDALQKTWEKVNGYESPSCPYVVVMAHCILYHPVTLVPFSLNYFREISLNSSHLTVKILLKDWKLKSSLVVCGNKV